MTKAAEVPLIPRKMFFENPSVLSPGLSPDGKLLSWLAPVKGVMNVWAAPRDDPAAAFHLTHQTDRPLVGHSVARTNAHVLFHKDRDGDENYHLWCVAIAGGEARDLTPYDNVLARFVGFHRSNPKLIGVAMNDRDARWHDLYVVDIESGDRKLLYLNTDEISSYILDSQLGLRLATSSRGKGSGSAILKWTGDSFSEIKSIDADDVLCTIPWHINRAGDAWYMTSSIGRDRSALLRIDWTTGAETVIAAHDKADVGSGLVDPRTDEVTATRTDYVHSEWLAIDPAIRRDLDRLQQDLGGAISIESQSDDDSLWVAAVSRPDLPPTWYLLDRPVGRLTKLFSSRPKLETVKLAPMRGTIIKSRDGLDLVSYLTLPAGETGLRPSTPVPLVLLVHGGPWWRDGWHYNRQTQWYANRGYGVLQVNYRGSTGFGKAFINAADKEWAGKMHDDLIDAVNWAVAEGIADRTRIAICGGSYGGYASFVGATFTPDVFCCSVPVVGISNLETLLATPPPYWASFYEQECHRIGDPRTEEGRALLKARSPLHRANEITKPMLIGHGANDVRCKVAESDQIVSAMMAKKIPVTYIVFPDEGHGFARPENNIAFNAMAEAFLARHLKGRCEPIGNDFEGSNHEIRAGAEILRTTLSGKDME